MKPVGLLGAGTMGLAAGRKILEAGRSLLVFDVSAGAQEKARSMGARVAATPAEIAGQADMVIMFLPGPKEVEVCVAGAGWAAPRFSFRACDRGYEHGGSWYYPPHG